MEDEGSLFWNGPFPEKGLFWGAEGSLFGVSYKFHLQKEDFDVFKELSYVRAPFVQSGPPTILIKVDWHGAINVLSGII